MARHSFDGMDRPIMTYQVSGSPRSYIRAVRSSTSGACDGYPGMAFNVLQDVTSWSGTSTVTVWVVFSAPALPLFRTHPSGRSHSQTSVMVVPSSSRHG